MVASTFATPTAALPTDPRRVSAYGLFAGLAGETGPWDRGDLGVSERKERRGGCTSDSPARGGI